jgi:DNA polymerase-3 subunit alpha
VHVGEKYQRRPCDFADDDVNIKGKRFAFPTTSLFQDHGRNDKVFDDLPQAIDNTNEIVDKLSCST